MKKYAVILFVVFTSCISTRNPTNNDIYPYREVKLYDSKGIFYNSIYYYKTDSSDLVVIEKGSIFKQ